MVLRHRSRSWLMTCLCVGAVPVSCSNLRVKYVSERALLYALEIHTRPETLNEFVAKAPFDTAKFVRDYAKRILVRLGADSDDEGGGR